MPEDPFDPNPESNWPKIMMILAGIAIVIIGVWAFAASLLSKSLLGH